MSISAVSSTSSSDAAAGNSSVNTRIPKHTLDPSDFMKLLAVQMQNQDPMAPMDNNAQMAQLAQMSSMEGMTQLTKSVASMSASQSLVLANSYLGKQATVSDAAGKPVTGLVTGVDASDTTLQLRIGDTYYPLSSLLRVELPPPAETTPPVAITPPADAINTNPATPTI